MLLFYLVVLGIRDYIQREIPLVWVLTGFPIAAGLGGYRCVQGELVWQEILVGIVPGILLLLMARFTGKAGYGDGLVLLQLGLCLGYRESFSLFCFGLLLLFGVSMILLLLRKVRKDSKMPYLMFLAIAYVLRQL